MTSVTSNPIILNYKNTNNGIGMDAVRKTPDTTAPLKKCWSRPAPINVAKANEGRFYSPDAVPSPGRAALVAGLRSATDRRSTSRSGSPTESAQRSPSSSGLDKHKQRLQMLQEQHSYEQKRLWIQQQQELFNLQQLLLAGGFPSAGDPRQEYGENSPPPPPLPPYNVNRPPRLLSQKKQEILVASNLLAQKQLSLRSIFSQQSLGTSNTSGSVYQHGLPSPIMDSSPSSASPSCSKATVPAAVSPESNNKVRPMGLSRETTPKTPMFNFSNSPPRRRSPSPRANSQGQGQTLGHAASVMAPVQGTSLFTSSSQSSLESGTTNFERRRGNPNSPDRSRFFSRTSNSTDSNSLMGHCHYQNSGLSYKLSAGNGTNKNYLL